jgi:hypothetical protein
MHTLIHFKSSVNGKIELFLSPTNEIRRHHFLNRRQQIKQERESETRRKNHNSLGGAAAPPHHGWAKCFLKEANKGNKEEGATEGKSEGEKLQSRRLAKTPHPSHETQAMNGGANVPVSLVSIPFSFSTLVCRDFVTP